MDVVDAGGEMLAVGMVPVRQQDAPAGTLPVGCGMLLSRRAGRAPGSAGSAHVSSLQGGKQ